MAEQNNGRRPSAYSGTSRNTSNRGRSSYQNRQRSAPRRRSPRKPIYLRLWFWAVCCTLIIILVLLTKGCDTGSVGPAEDVAATPAATGDAVQTPESDAGTPAESTPQTLSPPVNEDTSAGTATTTPTNPVGNTGTNQPSGTPSDPAQSTPTATDYFESHHVGAGTRQIGIDLPAGSVDITVLSGSGSIATSGGALSYAAFGQPYTTSAYGIVLKAGETLTVTGNLSMKFSYYTEPVYTGVPSSSDHQALYTLTEGTYLVGRDILSGVYDITAVSGYGEAFTSDAKNGTGFSEMMGVADAAKNYVGTVENVTLNEGVTLTLRGCTLNFVRK